MEPGNGIIERLVRLETILENVVKRLDHQDSCIDALKRQVWLATGAIALLMALLNLYAKFGGH